MAESDVVPPTCTAAGVAPTLTLIGGGGATVKLAAPLLVGSAFDVAVSETFSDVVPAGSDAGVV